MGQYKYYTMEYDTLDDIINIPVVCVEGAVLPATRAGTSIRVCTTYNAFHSRICAIEYTDKCKILRRSE